MKFGFNFLLYTTFFTEDLLPVAGMLAEAGYDGIELPAGDGPLSHYQALAPQIRDLGLEVTAVAMGLPEADPSSPDKAIRAAGLDRLRSRIECAAALGATILGGPLYAAHKHFSGEPLSDDGYRRAAEVLAVAAEDARAAGVTLCLEPLNRFEIALVNTAEQARRICELAGHPNVKIHYDTHHGHIEERSHSDALRTCGEHLGHVHVSESHRGALGTGMVNWQDAAAGLREQDYEGWITLEAFSSKVDVMRVAANVHRDTFSSREQVARDAIPFLRALLTE